MKLTLPPILIVPPLLYIAPPPPVWFVEVFFEKVVFVIVIDALLPSLYTAPPLTAVLLPNSILSVSDVPLMVAPVNVL